VRVDVALDAPSQQVAVALASALGGFDLVCCGDYSLDRGTGSVPAFLAGELGAAQALGLVDAEAAGPGDPGGALRVTRRLDQGRREILSVSAPAVLSFEGTLELRRAPLRRLLAAADAPVEVVPGPVALTGSVVTEVRRGPYRPRARALPPPAGDTRQRVLALTGALTQHTPPQLLELEPAEAAATILEQLRIWGHLPGGDPENTTPTPTTPGS
jgi:electron transfer flavoprotein beta subunit